MNYAYSQRTDLQNTYTSILTVLYHSVLCQLISPVTRIVWYIYEVCSKSIRIGIVVVVHLVGCVCNQSCHVRTCLSKSWHKLQVPAFAQLAAVDRGSNTCVYVKVIFTMCESTEQRICIKFCFKIGKTATETYQLLQQAFGEDAMGRTQCFTGSVDLKRVEPPLKATPARDDRQHRETRKWLLKLEQSFAITGDWEYKR